MTLTLLAFAAWTFTSFTPPPVRALAACPACQLRMAEPGSDEDREEMRKLSKEATKRLSKDDDEETKRKKQVAFAKRAAQYNPRNSFLQTGGESAGGGIRARGGRQKAKKTERKKASSGKGFGKLSPGLNFDRRPKDASAPCLCGNGGKLALGGEQASYAECCQPLHDGTATAQTPTALVRARFTAYAYRLPDYLMASTDPEGEEWHADGAAWKKSLLSFCDDFDFQKLTLDFDEEAEAGVEDGADEAVVGFRADIVQKGQINLMATREMSTFRRGKEGRWLYAKGEVGYEGQQV